MIVGYILNEGGIGGEDYRVVPRESRSWFPPYTADDGLITVHEDTYGVGGPSVAVFDTLESDLEFDDDDDEYDY